MRKYKHVFFDLDHTLWDFEKCSSEALAELFVSNQMMDTCSFTSDMFIKKFSEVNLRLWKDYNIGKIDRERLREDRFKIIFKELGSSNDLLTEKLANEYLQICPAKSHLIPYASEVLTYLSKKYELHIITNGFEHVQLQKIKSAKIEGFFKEVITSENSGYKKPEKEMFSYALNKVNCTASNCIMIGDDLEADIIGASNSSIDHIFFNRYRHHYKAPVTYEVQCLSEILNIL